MANPDIEIDVELDNNTSKEFDKLTRQMEKLVKQIRKIGKEFKKLNKAQAAVVAPEVDVANINLEKERIRSAAKVRQAEEKRQSYQYTSRAGIVKAEQARVQAGIEAEAAKDLARIQGEYRKEELQKQGFMEAEDARRKAQRKKDEQASQERQEQLKKETAIETAQSNERIANTNKETQILKQELKNLQDEKNANHRQNRQNSINEHRERLALENNTAKIQQANISKEKSDRAAAARENVSQNNLKSQQTKAQGALELETRKDVSNANRAAEKKDYATTTHYQKLETKELEHKHNVEMAGIRDARAAEESASRQDIANTKKETAEINAKANVQVAATNAASRAESDRFRANQQNAHEENKHRKRLEIEDRREQKELRRHERSLERERERTRQARIRSSGQSLGRRDYRGFIGTILDATVAMEGFGYAIAAVGGSIIRHASEFERLKKGLEAVTGSATAAASQLHDIRRIARLPGITFGDASRASLRLRASGFDQDTTNRLITEFGNAAVKSGAQFEDAAEALRQLTQIQSIGRFTAENLNQILERLPVLRTTFLQEFGTTVGGEVQKVLEKEGLSFAGAVEKLLTGLEKSERASGETLSNAVSNLGNAFGDLQRSIGSALIPTLTTVTKGLTSLVEAINTPQGAAATTGLLVGGGVYGGGKLIQAARGLFAGGVSGLSNLGAAGIAAGTTTAAGYLGYQYDPFGRILPFLDDRSASTIRREQEELRAIGRDYQAALDAVGGPDVIRLRKEIKKSLDSLTSDLSSFDMSTAKNLGDLFTSAKVSAQATLASIKSIRDTAKELVSISENQVDRLKVKLTEKNRQISENLKKIQEESAKARQAQDIGILLGGTESQVLDKASRDKLDNLRKQNEELKRQRDEIADLIDKNEKLLGISKDQLDNTIKQTEAQRRRSELTASIGKIDFTPSVDEFRQYGNTPVNRNRRARERREFIIRPPGASLRIPEEFPSPVSPLDISSPVNVPRPRIPVDVVRGSQARTDLQNIRDEWENIRETIEDISNINPFAPLRYGERETLFATRKQLQDIESGLLEIRKDFQNVDSEDFKKDIEDLNKLLNTLDSALMRVTSRLGDFQKAEDRTMRPGASGFSALAPSKSIFGSIVDKYAADFIAEQSRRREKSETDAQRALEIRQKNEDDRRKRLASSLANIGQSFYQQFGADFILETIGIGGRSQDRIRDSLDSLKSDFRDVQAEIRSDSTISEKERIEELKRLHADYIKNRRDIEKQAEEDRARAWRDWTKNVIVDFGRIIYEQLQLNLAMKASNLILNNIGLGSSVAPAAATAASAVGTSAGVGTAATVGTGVAIGATAVYGLIDPIKDLLSAFGFHNAANDQYAFQKAQEAGRKMFSGQTPEQYGRQSTKDFVDNMAAGLVSSGGGGGGGTTIVHNVFQVGTREIQEFFEVGNELNQGNRLVSPGNSSVVRGVETHRLSSIESNVNVVKRDVGSATATATTAKSTADSALTKVNALEKRINDNPLL